MKTLNLTLLGILFLTINVYTHELTSEDLIIEGKKIVQEGYSSFDKEKLLQARGLFERAISMSPDSEWALYHQLYTDYILTIYFMKEDNANFSKYMEIAEEEGNSLISAYPDNAEAKALMCSLYGIKISHNWESAQEIGPKANSLISEALEMAPNNPRILLQAGVSKYNTPEFYGGDKEKAVKLFTSAIEKFKNDNDKNDVKPSWGELEAYAWLGKAYTDMGEYDKAVDILESGLTINPNYGWIKYDLLPQAKAKLAKQ